MAKSRTKKALLNVGASFSLEIVKLICGLIVPRLILSSYGSAYNGVVSSISQFISCIALMKAGIGGATKAALYKPLADKDSEEISSVIVSTERFMQKVALLFLVFVVIFACVYPIWINTEFDFTFTFTLVIIVSLSTFAEYYFGFTYQLLLMSDQKEYYLTTLGIIQTIIGTFLSIVLINNGFGIHAVKVGSLLVSLIAPLWLYFYIGKKYKINHKAKPAMEKISQRWDAVAHEVATFVNNNTDIMVLTIFTNLLEVSVYTVYHYVIYNIKKIIKLSVSNFASAFGDMYVKGEHEVLEDNLGVFELIVNTVVSIMYSVTLASIVPFVLLYTTGVNDVDYARPLFARIAVLSGVFDCMRMPYKTVVTAIGHFKQTRNGAIFEAVLNITVSCIMVFKFGLVGVAIGTLVAMIFRTIQYSVYLSKKVLGRSMKPFLMHLVITLTIIFTVNYISKFYFVNADSWFMWALYALITTIIASALTMAGNYIFFRKYLILLITKLKNVFVKKKA